MTPTTAKIGDALPALVIERISRRDLAMYAGASGDDNPIHLDIDFARVSGHDDVFTHGMLSMAFLGRVLTRWARPEQIIEYEARFRAITPVGATLTCTGEVVDLTESNNCLTARVALRAVLENGVVAVDGHALIALGTSA